MPETSSAYSLNILESRPIAKKRHTIWNHVVRFVLGNMNDVTAIFETVRYPAVGAPPLLLNLVVKNVHKRLSGMVDHVKGDGQIE